MSSSSSRRLALALALVIAVTACSPQSRFRVRSVTINGRTYRYRVWLPNLYSRRLHWPVILFLHGSGERGDDNLRQLALGLPVILAKNPSLYHAIVVVPQCRPGWEWYGEMEQMALAALEKSIEEFRGDRRRIYLTGMSMGGAGTWYMARHPAKFAAIVPVCGEVVRQPDDPFPVDPPPEIARLLGTSDPFDALAQAIGRTPVWAFHGANDNVIPVTQSRRMVAALQAHHGNVRYTEYPHADHDVWDLAYADPSLPKWLLSQSRKRTAK